jgi:hypothetical protein
MADPEEGVASDGTIRAGAHRGRVPAAFEPVLADAVAFLGESGASLYVYGSVATGTVRPGSSDVDLLSIGLPEAAILGQRLSARYADRCRGVEVAAATAADFVGDTDAAYGNRVFLRHYSVHLAGPDPSPRGRHFLRTPGPLAVSTATSASISGDGGRGWSPGRWLRTCSVSGSPVRRSLPLPGWSASTTTPGRLTVHVLSSAGVNSSPTSPPSWPGCSPGPRASAAPHAKKSGAHSRTMESSLRSSSASVA